MSLELTVQPEVMTTDGGGAVRSQIFPVPKKILFRESFPEGQLMLICEIVIADGELLIMFQVALFELAEKLLTEIEMQGETAVFVGCS